MLQVHHRLKAGLFPNCRKLGEDLEVSGKTIQRDIDFMRDRLGLPIVYDQLRFGFFYSEPVTGFPTIEVSEGEVVALLVAEKALMQYRGTSFEKPLRAAFEKITEGLRGSIDFKWDEVDASISFKDAGAGVADLALFESVSRGVLRSSELSFEYRKLKSEKYETRRVHPYHLGCIKSLWYLFAYDLARGEVRTFALPRMRKVKETGARFRKPPGFSIARHLRGSFGVLTGKDLRRVRIRFDGVAARMVEERQWHPSQKIEQTGGGIELKLELNSLEEIKSWVLGWGAHARVLEPPELVDRVRAAIEELALVYATPVASPGPDFS